MTTRAELILSLLDSYRLLRTPHILEFLKYFEGQISDQKTLRLLRHLMDERRILRVRNDPYSKTVAKGSLPKIYGLPLRRNHSLNERREKVSAVVPHTLEIADTIVYGVVKPCRQSNGELQFIDTPEILTTMISEQTGRLSKPLTWKVKDAYFEGHKISLSTTPDRLFGVRLAYRKAPHNRWFFVLEEDRSSETILPKNLLKATIFRKVLCYCFARHYRLAEQMYNVRDFRVLFVTDSKKRAEHMVDVFDLANRELKALQKRQGLKPDGCPPNVFLFTDRPTLRSGNIFTTPWLNGRGETRQIEPPSSL
jgi:hypothetical protein